MTAATASPGDSAVLRNARLADGSMVDIRVVGGDIAAITAAGILRPAAESGRAPDSVSPDVVSIDLGGRLVLSALVEPHAHLDKALTADLVDNPRGDLMGAIDGWQAAYAAGLLGYDSIVARARATLEMSILNGVTLVRTHVNVSDQEQVTSIRAVKRAVESLAGFIDVQIVALTAPPITGAAGAANRRALEAAIEEGVDLVGGCPHLDTDAVTMIDEVISLADAAGIDIDLHVDETTDADVLTLRDLARAIMERGFAGRVTASHCVSLGMQPLPIQRAPSRSRARPAATATAPRWNTIPPACRCPASASRTRWTR